MTRAERRRHERDQARTRPRPRPRAHTSIWRSPIAVASGLAVVAAVVLIVALGQGRAPSSAGLVVPTTSYPPELIAGETVGRADAPVNLEIWSDFQCPFCGQLARTYLPRLMSDFVTGGQLRILPRDVAFVGRGDENESLAAAVAASCAADQGKYWQFHDLLFWNQDGENEGAFSEPRLQQMADAIGLDRASWDACRAESKRRAAVTATTSAAAAARITSTPTLVLNGVPSAGLPRTYDDLANAIRAMLTAPTNP